MATFNLDYTQAFPKNLNVWMRKQITEIHTLLQSFPKLDPSYSKREKLATRIGEKHIPRILSQAPWPRHEAKLDLPLSRNLLPQLLKASLVVPEGATLLVFGPRDCEFARDLTANLVPHDERALGRTEEFCDILCSTDLILPVEEVEEVPEVNDIHLTFKEADSFIIGRPPISEEEDVHRRYEVSWKGLSV